MAASAPARRAAILACIALPIVVAATCESARSAQVTSGTVSGSGIPGRLASWANTDSLTSAPIKVDSAGDIILKPAVALFILVGSRCFRFDSTGMTPSATGCPGL